MKKILIIILAIIPMSLVAQIGIKGGINFANVTGESSINNSSRSGFNGGLFMAPKPKGLIGFRSEINYSRQGYDFKTNTNTGNVSLDYILLPQFTTLNLTKFVQIQAGLQMAFLINASADETNGNSSEYGKLMDFYNKIDYGLAGGLEIHPFKGLIIGARYTLSLGNLYKNLESSSMAGNVPSFIPEINVRNNLFSLFAGWHFAK